jgi:outer membrane receptor for ferrienterochelin and colicins
MAFCFLNFSHHILHIGRHLGFLGVLSLSCVAMADDALQQVEVRGQITQQKERQDDIGMRSVIGRDEIEKYGDTSISDVLKRLPGVSVSEGKDKGVEIRLRGMGSGYTQILLNGQPMSAGFTLDMIAPDLIEKIEILRVASAGHSAQSIAGTINIILRKKTTKLTRDLTAALASTGGRANGKLGWSWSDTLGDVSYVWAGSLESNHSDFSRRETESWQITQPGVTPWQTLSARELQQNQQNRKEAISLTPRLQWKLDADNSLSWQSMISDTRPDQRKQEREQTLTGVSTEFPVNQSIWSAHMLSARNEFAWERRLADSAKWSLSVRWNHFDRASRFEFWGRDAASVLQEKRYVSADANENEYQLQSKYLAPYREHHVLSMGWEISRGARDETRLERDLPVPFSQTISDFQQYAAQMQKQAAYVQDEWTLTPAWAVYLGARWERMAAQANAPGVFHVSQQANLFSPVLQALWKSDPQTQWRFALNRTFKVPTLGSLIPRIIRIDNDNTPLNPDQQGNPQLRPERSWGLDMAYERYLSDSSLISASAYVRHIQDVTIDQLSQNNSGWLLVPANAGQALLAGLELEAKGNLRQLSSSLPSMDVRMTLGRNWSRLSQVPGPDNKLPGQLALQAGAGFDYQLLPAWRIGGDYRYQSASNFRQSDFWFSHAGPSRSLDVYLNWKAGQHNQWKLVAANILHQDRADNGRYQTPDQRWLDAGRQTTAITWRLIWDAHF